MRTRMSMPARRRGIPSTVIPWKMPNTKPINRVQESRAINQIIAQPQFPGQQDGATIEAVRAFIRDQARLQGFRFDGGVGTQEFIIDISGTAKFLLGIQFNEAFDADVQFLVNNEIIFDSVSVQALTPIGNPRSNKDWFVVNRPLAGTDKIKLVITSFEVYENTPFTIYYI